MSELVQLTLDLSKIGERISAILGKQLSQSELIECLISQGILPAGDKWIAYASDMAGYLQFDEILSAGPYDGPLPRLEGEVNPKGELTSSTAVQDTKVSASVDPYWIPSLLIGTRREVHLRLKQFVKSAVRCGEWSSSPDELHPVPIDDAPGKLLLAAPSPFFEGGDHVHLYMMNELLMYTTRGDDRREWYYLQRRMVLKGLDYFWFFLNSLNISLISVQELESDIVVYAREALSKMLSWWDKLSELDARFSNGLPEYTGVFWRWPVWGGQAFRFCSVLGMPEEDLNSVRSQPPLVAGRMMRSFLEAV